MRTTIVYTARTRRRLRRRTMRRVATRRDTSGR